MLYFRALVHQHNEDIQSDHGFANYENQSSTMHHHFDALLVLGSDVKLAR
jgi:hypothetical protein